MPIPLEHRVAFNEVYNDDDAGGPWTLEGRDYVLDEMWRPLESFRAWPRRGTAPLLCDACRVTVGTIVQDTRLVPVAHDDCPGLDAKPIAIVGTNVPRRSGKTLNGLAYAQSVIFLEPNKRVAYIAAAEDQAEELVEQKLGSKIRKHPALAKRCDIVANKITVPKKNSWLEVLPASHASVTGRGYTHIIFDETRDILARVFGALAVSILASHGVECENAHGSWPVNARGAPPPTHCPSCGAELRRWYARILAMSASGLVDDVADKDWYDVWIQKRLEKPHPNVHVWRTEQRVNPTVSVELADAMLEAFEDVPGMADIMNVEIGNKPMRRGEVYLKPTEVQAIADHSLKDQDASTLPAVAFVDTSKTGDKTSLVVCVDETTFTIACDTCGFRGTEAREHRVCAGKLRGPMAFERMALLHLQVWDPADRSSCPGGFVDPLAVEAHLDRVVPRFTRLLKLHVDTRVMPWAKQLVAKCQAKPWGRGRVEGFEGKQMADSAMYLELLDRVTARTLRIPNDARLVAELIALRKQDLPGGGIKVLDPNADKSGRNRRVGGIHRDIAMSLAGCCLLAAELRLEMPSQLSSVDTLVAELDRSMPKPIMGDLAQGKF